MLNYNETKLDCINFQFIFHRIAVQTWNSLLRVKTTPNICSTTTYCWRRLARCHSDCCSCCSWWRNEEQRASLAALESRDDCSSAASLLCTQLFTKREHVTTSIRKFIGLECRQKNSIGFMKGTNRSPGICDRQKKWCFLLQKSTTTLWWWRRYTVKPFNLAVQKVGDLACKIILAN